MHDILTFLSTANENPSLQKRLFNVKYSTLKDGSCRNNVFENGVSVLSSVSFDLEGTSTAMVLESAHMLLKSTVDIGKFVILFCIFSE